LEEVTMSLEVKRLHLASLRGVDGLEWPVHGFVVTHPGGAVLVDTGVGGPQEWLNDWRVVNRSAADALAELDMTPGDIDLVINTHLLSTIAARMRSSRTPPVTSSVRS
jgi:glyoxylase-like metal-dependent hydrolase (beta-lactamase superfamily II)